LPMGSAASTWAVVWGSRAPTTVMRLSESTTRRAETGHLSCFVRSRLAASPGLTCSIDAAGCPFWALCTDSSAENGLGRGRFTAVRVLLRRAERLQAIVTPLKALDTPRPPNHNHRTRVMIRTVVLEDGASNARPVAAADARDRKPVSQETADRLLCARQWDETVGRRSAVGDRLLNPAALGELGTHEDENHTTPQTAFRRP